MKQPSVASENQSGNWQLTVIAVILIGCVLTYLGPILTPLFSAVFVYFLIRPAADWLMRRGLAKWIAYLILFLLASAVVTGLMWILGENAIRFQKDWPRYRNGFLELATQWGVEEQASEVLSALTPERLISMVVNTGTKATEFGMLIVFYLFFLIMAVPKLPARVNRGFPTARAERVLAIGNAISDGMAKYMEVKTSVNAGLAISVGIVLAWFRVDYWPLWAVLMFALNYVTYVGSMAALVPPMLLGFLKHPTGVAILLVVLLIAIRFVWIDILEVRMAGKHMNIDSLVLLLFMSYWGWAWGLIGLVLAVPIATCIRAGLAEVEATKPFAELMSED